MNSFYGSVFFFFQAEDGIRDLVRSRGLGDVYKRQPLPRLFSPLSLLRFSAGFNPWKLLSTFFALTTWNYYHACLLYTSDAADERSSVDLGGRRIIKKKKTNKNEQPR